MFKKMLSSIGIGAAKVDTILHQEEVMRGESVTGEIHITGGKIAQPINKIYLELTTNYYYEREDHDGDETEYLTNFVLEALDIEDSFTIEAGEETIFDFELAVPLCTPLSFNRQKVWVRTGLDVSMALDPSDNDPLTILPDPATDKILAAAEALGLHHTHHSGTCHEYPNPFGVPYVQEFCFKPQGGPLAGRVDEIEMLIAADSEVAQVIMEVDKRGRGLRGFLAEAMDRDEKHAHVEVGHDDAFGPQDLLGIIEDNL